MQQMRRLYTHIYVCLRKGILIKKRFLSISKPTNKIDQLANFFRITGLKTSTIVWSACVWETSEFFGKPGKWMYAWPSILHIFCIFMDFWQPSTNSNRCGGVAIPVVAGFQQGTIRENWQWEYFGNDLVMNTNVMLKRKKEFKIGLWSGRIKLISFQF